MYTKTQAAFIILKEHGKPLHVKEIIRIALSKKMIDTKGKTPIATLLADFHNENKRRAKRNDILRFVRISPGIWGLAEWGLTPIKTRKGTRDV